MLKVIILILSVVLAGCATSPQKLGIPDQEWAGYSETEREQMLANYQQITAIEKQDAKPGKVASGSVNVTISDGEVMMPPFTEWSNYQSASVTLDKDSCNDAILKQANDAAQIVVRLCYKNQALFLDPSRYDLTKSDGSISIPFSPFWKDGFVYKGISSSGYARLKNVNIKITEIPS